MENSAPVDMVKVSNKHWTHLHSLSFFKDGFR